MLKFMDYQVLVETSIALLNRITQSHYSIALLNRITQSLTLLPAETSYKSVYRDFIAGLENDSTLKLLKYDTFRKLWHQLTPYIQDLCGT